MLDVIKAPLQALDATHFINEYWQKKPLLFRGAFPSFNNPLSAEELAGLAMHEDVESRIVRELESAPHWQIVHGPFAESTFTQLPENKWTLLVQDIDKHLPDIGSFLDHFSFLPRWRIDDLMISAATDGGSVGPHLDAYDVFLLQAEGQREWQLAWQTDGIMREGLELAVLASFNAEEIVVLAPGDMLYLPPGLAHYGIAKGDCMTWSIGFRAPDLAALLPDYTEWQLASQATRLYSDADLDPAEVSDGRLSRTAIQRARELVRSALDSDETGFTRWFGCHVTEPKSWLRAAPPEQKLTPAILLEYLHQNKQLERNSLSRFTFSEIENQTWFFFDGREREASAEQRALLVSLCTQRIIGLQDLPDPNDLSSATLLAEMVNQGCLLFVEHKHG